MFYSKLLTYSFISFFTLRKNCYLPKKQIPALNVQLNSQGGH